MTVDILVGDCRQTLKRLPDQSVHCVVTSPPYWGLRSYKGDPGMIGLEPTFDEHVANLLAVFDEVWRVLRDDGTVWLNYGDAYWGGKGASSSTVEGYERRTSSTLNKDHHHVNEFGSTRPLDRRDQGFKPKDLVMMPARVAMAMQEHGCADLKAVQTLDRVISEICDEYNEQPIPDKIDNVLDRLYAEYHEAKGKSWYLRSEIVWAKRNSMPESVKDRPTSSHEKVFLFAKQPKYFYDHVAVRTKRTADSIARDYRAYGGKPETPPGMPEHSGDLFQPRINPNKTWPDDAPQNINSLSRPERQKERWPGIGKQHADARDRGESQQDMQVQDGANLRNVWHLATESFKGAHFATFPTKLVEPCIKAGTSEHGVCGATGAPYVRESTKTCGSPHDGKTKSEYKKGTNANRLALVRQAARERGGEYAQKVETTGWKPTCGAPYKRIVEVKGGSGKSWHDHSDDLGHGQSAAQLPGDYSVETKGWEPTCECNGNIQPAVVLDPFGGSGTVSVVSERLGRDSIICEISPEYAEIARKRIEDEHLPVFPSEIRIKE